LEAFNTMSEMLSNIVEGGGVDGEGTILSSQNIWKDKGPKGLTWRLEVENKNGYNLRSEE
jgi:hypothetical protein